MSNLKFSTLKSILASASVAAVMLGSSSAMAANISTNVGNNTAHTATAGDWTPAQTPVAGDNIILTSNMTAISLNSGANKAFGTFSFNNIAAVNQSLGIGDTSSYSFTDMVNIGAGSTMNLNFFAAGSISISNTENAIFVVNFINSDGSCAIGTGNIQNNVYSQTTANIGSLYIGGTTTVGGTVGNGAGSPIKLVSIANGGVLTVTGSANALTVTLVGTGAIVANGGLNATNLATSSGSSLTIGNGQTLNVGSSTGTGSITTAGTSTLAGNLGQTGSNGANTLTAINLGGTTTLGLGTSDTPSIVATNITGNSTLHIAQGSSPTITAKVSSTVPILLNGPSINLTLGDGTVINGTLTPFSGSQGAVTIAGAVTLNQGTGTLYAINLGSTSNLSLGGNIAAATNLVFTGASTVSVNGNTVTVPTVDFAGFGGILNLGNGGQIAANVDGDAAHNTTIAGTINVAGNANTSTYTSTITGSVGATQAVNQINIGAAGNTWAKLNVGGNLNVYKIVFGDSHSTLTATGSNIVIAGTTGAGNISLNHNDAINFTGNVGSASVPLTSFLWDNGAAQELNIFSSGAKIYATNIGGNHAGSTLNVNQDSTIGGTVNANANTTFGAGWTLTLADGTVYGSTIDGSIASSIGTLAIAAPASGNAVGVTLNGVVGGTRAISGITIAGGAVLNAGANIAATNGVSFSGAGTFNLGTHTLNGSVNLANSGILTVYGAGNVTGGVNTGGVDNVGVVNRSSDNTGIIGSAGSRVYILNLGGNGDTTIDQNVFAGIVNVIGGTANINANIGSNAANSTTSVFLTNGVSLNIAANSKIYGPISGTGSVLFNGDPSATLTAPMNVTGTVNLATGGTINNNITTGSLATISADTTLSSGNSFSAQCVCIAGGTFTAATGSTVTITDATGIYGGGTYQPNQGGVLPQLGSAGHNLYQAFPNPANTNQTYQASGTYYITKFYIGTNAILDTSASGLNLNGGLALAGGATLTLGAQTLSVTGNTQVLGPIFVNTTVDGNGNLGNIASGGQTQLATKNIQVNITNKTILASGTKSLFSNVDGAATVTINGSGLNTFTYNTADGTLTIGQNPVYVAQVSSSLSSSGNVASSDVVSSAVPLTDAAVFAAEVTTALADGEIGTVELLDSMISQVEESVAQTVIKTTDAVSARLTVQVPSSSIGSVSKFSKSGVSSGEDEGRKYGLWVEGFAGMAKQKAKSGHNGYKSNYYGGVVGVDTPITDSDVLGAALIYSDNALKTSNKSFFNKSKSKSAILSLYGMHDFGNNWYVNSIASFGNSWVVSKNKKQTYGVGSTSTGKYSSKFGALDVGAEYRYALSESIHLTPEARLRAIISKNDSYKEKGGAYNRSIKSKTGTVFEGVFGGTLSSRFDYKTLELMPSVYAKVIQNLGGKNQKVSIRLDGQQVPITTKIKPRNNTVFNLGGDFIINAYMIEYGAGYDIELAKKYFAQTGSLKLRVNL